MFDDISMVFVNNFQFHSGMTLVQIFYPTLKKIKLHTFMTIFGTGGEQRV
jgi:hypothetical protein